MSYLPFIIPLVNQPVGLPVGLPVGPESVLDQTVLGPVLASDQTVLDQSVSGQDPASELVQVSKGDIFVSGNIRKNGFRIASVYGSLINLADSVFIAVLISSRSTPM